MATSAIELFTNAYQDTHPATAENARELAEQLEHLTELVDQLAMCMPDHDEMAMVLAGFCWFHTGGVILKSETLGREMATAIWTEWSELSPTLEEHHQIFREHFDSIKSKPEPPPIVDTEDQWVSF